MFFIVLLIISALTIASVAAGFSIYGLAAIFSGIFIPVIIMGISLEIGKLMAVSYLYRYYKTISTIMKTYLMSAILGLMILTSMGIFGFLSMGYQKDISPLEQQKQQIELLKIEKTELLAFKKERLERRKQIDADIASLPNNFIKGRQRLMKSYGPELDQLRKDIKLYTTQINKKTLKISELKQSKLINELHVGPIIYIASAFSMDTDNAVKWIILLIIFIFDPLAVALILAANHTILIRKKELEIDKPKIKPLEKIIINETEVVQEIPPEPVMPPNEDVKEYAVEPKPKPESLVINYSSNPDVEDLKTAISELQNIKETQQRDLTITEATHMGMLEEMLERKLVTEKIRNPEKNT